MYSNKKLQLADKLALNKTPGHKYWDAFLALPEDEALVAFQKLTESEKRKHAFKKFVCIVSIETSTYCNRKCDYCPDKDPKYKRHSRQNIMAENIWQRFLADLEELDYSSTVSMNLYNEALADPALEEKIKELRARLPKCFINFNSNGDYLDLERVRSLEKSGLDAILITLHTAPGKSYSDEDRMTHLAKFFRRIQYEGPITEFVPGKRIRSEFYYNDMRFVVMCENWGDHGTSRGGIIPELDSDIRQTPCLRPLREFIVSNKGYVYPCCQIFPDEKKSDQYRLGDISEKHLWDIYGENKSIGWRTGQFTFGDKEGVCSKCSDPDFADVSSQVFRARLIESV